MHQSDPSSIPSGHCPAPHCCGTSPGQLDFQRWWRSTTGWLRAYHTYPFEKLNSSLLKSHRAPKGKYYSLLTGVVFFFGYIIVKLFPMLTGSLSMATGGDGTNITNWDLSLRFSAPKCKPMKMNASQIFLRCSLGLRPKIVGIPQTSERSFLEGHLAEVDINRSGELHQSSNSIVALAPSWTCFWLVTLVRRTSEGYCGWCWSFTISLSLPSIRCFQRNSTTTRSWLAAWQAAPWMGGIEGVLWCELWEICLGPSNNLHTIQYPPSGWTGLVLFDTCGGLCQSWLSPQCWCSGHEARGRDHFLRHHS